MADFREATGKDHLLLACRLEAKAAQATLFVVSYENINISGEDGGSRSKCLYISSSGRSGLKKSNVSPFSSSAEVNV
jgi:hypothetical protein